MSSLGSRVSGYPGADSAADYVEKTFHAAGLREITREEFELTVPMDRGGQMTIAETGERIPLDGLWPNHVRTNTMAPEGVAGQLVYGGYGRMAELNGKQVDGSVVLLEFNSGNRWLQSASLGARAIVFIEPEATFWSEANAKSLSIPLDLPRFWVDSETGARLRSLAEEGYCDVRITSRMDWEVRQGINIWGLVPGRHESLREEDDHSPGLLRRHFGGARQSAGRRSCRQHRGAVGTRPTPAAESPPPAPSSCWPPAPTSSASGVLSTSSTATRAPTPTTCR